MTEKNENCELADVVVMYQQPLGVNLKKNLVWVIMKENLSRNAYLCTSAIDEWQLFRSWYTVDSILGVFLKW